MLLSNKLVQTLNLIKIKIIKCSINLKTVATKVIKATLDVYFSTSDNIVLRNHYWHQNTSCIPAFHLAPRLWYKYYKCRGSTVQTLRAKVCSPNVTRKLKYTKNLCICALSADNVSHGAYTRRLCFAPRRRCSDY